jgi:hypothetical protein
LPRPCLRHDDEHGGAELVAARAAVNRRHRQDRDRA